MSIAQLFGTMFSIICGGIIMLHGIFMTCCIVLQMNTPFSVHKFAWDWNKFYCSYAIWIVCGGFVSFLLDCLSQWIIMMLTVAALMAAGMQNFMKHQQYALCLSLALTCWPFLWLLQVTACCVSCISATIPNGVTGNAHMMAEFDVLLMPLFRLLHYFIFNPMISEFKQVTKGTICTIYHYLCSIQTDTYPIVHQKPWKSWF